MTGSEDSPTPEEVFGGMVRQAREARGWSQGALAQHMSEAGIKLHQTGVARLEAGERPTRFNEVVALSQLLGLKLSMNAFAPDDSMSEDEFVAAHDQLAAIREEIATVVNSIADIEQQRHELMRVRQSLVAREQVLEHQIAQVRAHRQGLAAATENLNRAMEG